MLVDAHRAEEQRHQAVRVDELTLRFSLRRASTQFSRSPAAMKVDPDQLAGSTVTDDDARRAQLSSIFFSVR